MKRKGLSILKFVVSIGLMLFLISRIDVDEFLTVFGQVDIALFGIAMTIAALGILIRSYKWKLLLQIQGANLQLRTIQAINYMSLFFNNFFLGTIAGDIFRVYKTMPYPHFKSGAVSSVIMDRITGLSMLFVIIFVATTGNFFTHAPVFTQGVLYASMTISVTALISMYIISRMAPRMGNLKARYKYQNVTKYLDDFIQSMKIHQNHGSTLMTCLMLSLCFQITKSISVYFCALSTHVNTNFLHFIFIVPVVTFIIMLPISVNGIGLQEGAFFFYFEKIGVDATSALLIALLPRIIMLIFGLIGGVIYMLDGKLEQSLKPKSPQDNNQNKALDGNR